MAIAHTLLHGLDDFPLAQQHVAQRHFARAVCVPDITASLGKILEFRNGKTFASRPAQRLLPDLTLQHNGIPVKQVLFRPLHCLGNVDAPILIPNLTCTFGQFAQGRVLSFAQLRLPQNREILSAQVFLLPGTVGFGSRARKAWTFAPPSSGFSASNLASPSSI